VFENRAPAKATHAGVLKGSANEAEQNQRDSLTGRAPFWGIFFHTCRSIVSSAPHQQLRDRNGFQTDYVVASAQAGLPNGKRMSLQLVPKAERAGRQLLCGMGVTAMAGWREGR